MFHYNAEMNFVDPDPSHLLLHEAAALVGCSTKTIRRAVRVGQLPQRYVRGPRGPYLVFLRAEIEQWCAVATPRRRGRPPRSAPAIARVSRGAGSLHTSLAKLQAALDGYLVTARQYHAAMDQHDEVLTEVLMALATHTTTGSAGALVADAPGSPGKSANG